MQRFFPGCVYLKGESTGATADVTGLSLDKKGQTLRPGDKITIEFDLPAGREYTYISASFSRRSSGYNNFSMSYNDWSDNNSLNYDKGTGHVSGSYTLTSDMSDGLWYLSLIYANTDGGYVEKSYQPDDGWSFTLEGAQAVTDVKIESVTCDKDGKNVTDGDTVTFRVKAAGTEGVSITLTEQTATEATYTYGTGVTENAASIFIPCNYNEASGLFEGSYTFKDTDVYGVYAARVSAGSAYLETGIMLKFDERGAAGFRRFDKATKLAFKDGVATFKLPDNHIGGFQITYYRAADMSTVGGIRYNPRAGTDFSWTETRGVDHFLQTEDLRSGDYFFTVIVTGDGTDYFDSEAAKSPVFTYREPAKQLGHVTGLGWDGAAQSAVFTPPADRNLGNVEITWYFSENEGGEPVRTSVFSHWYATAENSSERIPDIVLRAYGAGYYYFKARAITNNVLEARNGEWSGLSPAFRTASETEPTISALDEILRSGKTGQQVRDAVQELDTDELRLAMLTDDTVVDKLRELEAHAGSRTVVNVTKDELSGTSAVGAGLNSGNGDDVILNVGQPKREHVLDAMYDNTVALQFSMGLDNVNDDNDLKVPVQVILPVPAGIDPNVLLILHYPDGGGDPVPVHHQVFQAGGRYYTVVVLTGFSDFVMTQEAKYSKPSAPEYLLLKKGETYDCNPAEDALGFRIEEWKVTDENGTASNVVAVNRGDDGSLTITAARKGTAFVLLMGERDFWRLRVDVVETENGSGDPIANPAAAAVKQVRLLDAKATVELFKTDYAILPLMLEMERLGNAGANANAAKNPMLPGEEIPELLPTGAAVTEAHFTNAAVAALFELGIRDDHSLAIVPKYETMQAARAKASNVKASYKSGIAVTVDGKSFEVVGANGKPAVLALSVKQNMPKLKVGALKLNSALIRGTAPGYVQNVGNRELISLFNITGGTVTDLVPDTEAAAKAKKAAIPAWMELTRTEDGFGVLPSLTMPEKGSGKLFLMATVEGWAVKAPLTIPYSAAATYPKVTYKPATVTVNPKYGDSAVLLATIKSEEFANSERFVPTFRITEGSGNNQKVYDSNKSILVSWAMYGDTAQITVSPVVGAAVFQDGKAHTFKVSMRVAGKDYPFTVKTAANAAKPVLTVKASGTIDTGIPGSYLMWKLSTKNYSL